MSRYKANKIVLELGATCSMAINNTPSKNKQKDSNHTIVGINNSMIKLPDTMPFQEYSVQDKIGNRLGITILLNS